jgi:hypothetical protein
MALGNRPMIAGRAGDTRPISACGAAGSRRRGDRIEADARGSDHDETSPQKFSASDGGRCRRLGYVAHRRSADLSVALNHDGRTVRSGRARRLCTPLSNIVPRPIRGQQETCFGRPRQ